jgi:hypothetical protein
MKKLNKSQFNQVIEALRFTINDSRGAVGVDESLLAAVRIQNRGNDLMSAMAKDLNTHAKKLLPEAEAMIDRAVHYIMNLEVQAKSKLA